MGEECVLWMTYNNKCKVSSFNGNHDGRVVFSEDLIMSSWPLDVRECPTMPLVLWDKDGSDPWFSWQFLNFISGPKLCTARGLTAANKWDYSNLARLCIIYLRQPQAVIHSAPVVWRIHSDHTFTVSCHGEPLVTPQLCPLFRCARPNYLLQHNIFIVDELL